MEEKDLKDDVVKAVEAADAEPTTASKEVPSEDVKPVETEPAKKEEARPVWSEDVSKLSEQVSNLNTALKQEREEKKALELKLKEFWESTKTLDKLKSVFVEPKETEEKKEQKFMTEEEIEAFLERKRQDDERKIKEEQLAKSIKEEISNLEKEWDWSNWKPKYVDEEIYTWQKDNGKLYLRPSEAFSEMKKQEIIDYEVSKRLSNKPEVKTPWKTGWVQEEVKGEWKKTIMSEQELRWSILEIFENANSWNNN